METKSIKVDVDATAMSQAPSLGFLSTVVISLNRQVEEFILDESDGSVSSLGSYPSSSLPDRLTSLQFQNFTPDYVYQLLHNKLHDPVLSRLVSDQIVAEAQQRDLPQGPLFLMVFVKLTQKVYVVVPSIPPTPYSDQESCAICLENMSPETICQLPNCSHFFHEECVIKWLDRKHDSCPLCRQAVYKQHE